MVGGIMVLCVCVLFRDGLAMLLAYFEQLILTRFPRIVAAFEMCGIPLQLVFPSISFVYCILPHMRLLYSSSFR